MDEPIRNTETDLAVASALADDLGFLLAKASTAAALRSQRALREHGLRVRTYSLLCLACEQSAATQREIAAALSLDPSQVVPLVDELETAGLVERVPDSSDRRQKRIVATALGRDLHATASEAVRAVDIGVPAAFSDRDRADLMTLLRRIIAADTISELDA